MSTIRSNKKKVSFLEVGESRKTNLKRSNLKRGSILKSRPKMIEEEKVIEPIENKTEKVKIEIKKEEPVDTKSKTSLKNLPTDKY